MKLRLLPAGNELGWMPHLWLFYVLFIPMDLLLFGARAPYWWRELAGIAIFLPLYYAGYWLADLALLAIIGAIFFLGVAFAGENPGAAAYYIYAAAFVGFSGRPMRAYQTLGILLAGVATVAWLEHYPIYTWVMALGFSAMVGAANIRTAENKRTNAQLRMAREEIERLAALAERERIARDLHDVLGHTLSVIVLKAELASKLADRDTPRALAEIRDVERIARESLAELRETVAGYRASGIAAEIERARNVLGSAEIALRVEAEPLSIPVRLESVVALALREAITNVVRHARASACTITLARAGDACRLCVVDDGIGTALPEGAGLAGMRERVEGLGGTLERRSDRGTHLTVTIPLAAAPS